MDEELKAQQRSVQQHNRNVGLLENLKTFLRRLFSDLLNIAKNHTWDVRVQNPITSVEVSNLENYRQELSDILSAINSQEFPSTDLAPVVEAIQCLLDKPDKEMELYDDKLVIEELKGLKTAIESLPAQMPKSEKQEAINLKKLEDSLEKIYEVLRPKPLPKTAQVKTEEPPVKLSEEVVTNDDGDPVMCIEHWDKFDMVSYRRANGNSIVWTEPERQEK